MDKQRIAILGASGYTGAELVRLLAHHPAADVVLVTADRHAGEAYAQVYPHLANITLPDLIPLDEVEWAGLELDLVFCALPHATTQKIVLGLFHATGHSVVDELFIEREEDLVSSIKKPVKVIDLSADFRLKDVEVYAQWYGAQHAAPALQNRAVYGLTEFARAQIAAADLVACPGCYPTAALLPLKPLLEAGAIKSDGIIIDAKSGVSGAGRSAREANLFTEVSEAVHAYGIGGHRHVPEIEQELTAALGESGGDAPVQVTFTPHLMPMNRGILATCYVNLAGDMSADGLRDILGERYANEPFITVVPEGVSPATRHVRGTNRCHIGVFADRVAGRAIIISVIDNLVKGASGQAVQNMNVMLGIPEITGLEQEALFP